MVPQVEDASQTVCVASVQKAYVTGAHATTYHSSMPFVVKHTWSDHKRQAVVASHCIRACAQMHPVQMRQKCTIPCVQQPVVNVMQENLHWCSCLMCCTGMSLHHMCDAVTTSCSDKCAAGGSPAQRHVIHAVNFTHVHNSVHTDNARHNMVTGSSKQMQAESHALPSSFLSVLVQVPLYDDS